MTELVFAVTWAVVATIAAGVAAGLWLGERGRRIDAQMREGVLPTPPRWKARTNAPGDAAPELNEEMREAKERYVDEAVREGFSAKAAAEEFDRLLAGLYTDRGVG